MGTEPHQNHSHVCWPIPLSFSNMPGVCLSKMIFVFDVLSVFEYLRKYPRPFGRSLAGIVKDLQDVAGLLFWLFMIAMCFFSVVLNQF